MTVKKRSFSWLTKPSSVLVLLGKPLYQLITLVVITLFAIVTLFNKTKRRVRLPKVKTAALKVSAKGPVLKVLALSIPSGMFLVGSILLYNDVAQFFLELPDVSTLPTYQNYASTKLYDRNGKLLYKFYDEVDRTPITLAQIPLSVRQATIAAEDHDFYKHRGVSPKAIARALWGWMQGGKLTGASTITQQLVKNVYLSPERTLERKLKEFILAIRVEQTYPKDKILEYYLNRVAYGGTLYGVQEASRSYFNKDVRDLSIAESAFLASLPQRPSVDRDPNDADVIRRRNNIINQMAELGYISKAEEKRSIDQELAFKQVPLFTTAPHFIMYVRDLLARSFGENKVFHGGLTVHTTIDPEIQTIAEKAINDELGKIKKLNVSNAGALVISTKTGEILAMVGSRDYNDFARGGNVNTTLALRQPGSSIKVVNYAYALSHGFTPASILDDTPVKFTMAGAPPYIPKNYDGTFKGKIAIREALAQSRNIPAVRLLASYGVSNMIDLGQKMGITSWGDTKRFGLSLTLGGGEVTLMDLSSVYLTLGNYGKKIGIKPIAEITDVKGRAIAAICQTDCGESQVVSPAVAFQIIDILSDNKARTPAFGQNSALVVPNHPEVAVKTGTSNNLRDNLTVGFNADYLVAVWVGNNDGSSMSRVASGVTGASPIWNSIMKSLLKNTGSKSWPVPSGITQVSLCNGKKEWFVDGTVPTFSCEPNVALNRDQKNSIN